MHSGNYAHTVTSIIISEELAYVWTCQSLPRAVVRPSLRLREQETGYLFQENIETKANNLGLGYREHIRFKRTWKQRPLL